MLGPIAPIGASSRRAISSVASAATNVATTASIERGADRVDRHDRGAQHVRRVREVVAGVRERARGRDAQRTVSDGSSTTIANHAPTTSATRDGRRAGSSAAARRARGPRAGSAAATSNGDDPRRTREDAGERERRAAGQERAGDGDVGRLPVRCHRSTASFQEWAKGRSSWATTRERNRRARGATGADLVGGRDA